MLFPICWEEPFGLVMIEAMACGTPVVALRRGSVPEIIVNGVTGIVTDDPEQLPEAIELARLLDPAACQAHVAAKFTTELMAARYEDAYLRVLAETPAPAAMATGGCHAEPPPVTRRNTWCAIPTAGLPAERMARYRCGRVTVDPGPATRRGLRGVVPAG